MAAPFLPPRPQGPPPSAGSPYRMQMRSVNFYKIETNYKQGHVSIAAVETYEK
jgi:hypothetical protein